MSAASNYGVVGSKIAYSKSPLIHTAWLSALAIEESYALFDIDSRIFPDFVTTWAKKKGGFNVTIPYKETIIPLLDHLDGTAERCGAVNTVVARDGELTGYNTDGAGFVAALKDDPACFKKVAIVGNGGAARGVCAALHQQGVCRFVIYGRSATKSRDLADMLEALGAHCKTDVKPIEALEEPCVLKGVDLLVHAIPADVAIDFNQFSGLVYDLRYKSGDRLLVVAKKRQLQVCNGLEMLVYQAAESFNLWFGKRPNADMIRDVISKLNTI